MQGSIISDNKDLLVGNYLTSEEASLNILDPPSLYVENNYVELLNIYPEGVSVHYALNKTPTRDDSVLDKSTLLPSNGNYYFKAFGENKESIISNYKISFLNLNPILLENATSSLNTSPFAGSKWEGAYGNGMYLFVNLDMVSNYYSVWYSQDGINYEHTNDMMTTIRRCCFLKDKFFIIEENEVWYSTDAMNFNGITDLRLKKVGNIVYANGLFYAIAIGTLYTSEDGINWNETSIKFPTSNAYKRSIYYGNNILFTICNEDNKAQFSSNGIDWETQDLVICPDYIYFLGNKFVGSYNNYPVYSYNGKDWYFSYVPSFKGSEDKLPIGWKSYGKGIYLAVMSNTSGVFPLISVDGIHYTPLIYGKGNGISNATIIQDKLFFETTDGSDRHYYYCQL